MLAQGAKPRDLSRTKSTRHRRCGPPLLPSRQTNLLALRFRTSSGSSLPITILGHFRFFRTSQTNVLAVLQFALAYSLP